MWIRDQRWKNSDPADPQHCQHVSHAQIRLTLDSDNDTRRNNKNIHLVSLCSLPGWRIRNTFMQIRIHRFTVMRIRIRLFTLTRIRTWLLIKVIQICDDWSTDHPQLHFEPPSLQSERRSGPSTAPDFNFTADPDPAFQYNAGPDKAS
jgi:hypothetical protein